MSRHLAWSVLCVWGCAQPLPQERLVESCAPADPHAICAPANPICPVTGSLQEWVESYDIWENGHTDQPI